MASSWEDGASILRRPADAGARKRPAPGASNDLMGFGDDEEPQAGVAPEEPAPEAKPRKKRNIFSEQHLLSDRGFRAVYNSFPSHFNTAVPEGQEALALRDLMTCYKEWAFELFPALRFEDFVDRTEVIAKKAAVGELLQELRSKEAKRGEPEPDFAEIVHSTASARDSSSSSHGPRDAKGDVPRSNSFDDALAAEQDMQALLEYEAMLASTRDDARKVPAQVPSKDESSDEEEFQAPTLKAVPRPDVASDSEAEVELPPLSKVAEKLNDAVDEPRDAIDEPSKATDEPREAIDEQSGDEDDGPMDEVDDDPAVDAEDREEAPSQAAVEPASQMDEPASQAIDDDDELPSDEEAGDVMEYEARTSILRDMVETTETRRPRTSKALDEAATMLEEESDSDAELDFPATRFGAASQVPATQGEDDDETQVT
ncbi:hypothetical protein SPRG_19172 [Saprolegnia parasitica CBS 223.65]|uniref:Chromosome segregation in meiosis protein 3 domain-containing protein n=1 Tax=Saprolegnia parasitica (strain CBS 223.65) TaxID=695850 RepID=A0A067CS53_SAPPC|nr:hypothetical protein SPRG_19172 [Saprolegnia parasitica CBS 223.65]KDO33539.1 hypothetical protein SPRG_19172 [Saprolegnia parasitica CBS 223.65]|eukprot:XP_012195599.1 hypothetical protein SPRG_19172 [Saprolegnia parasitica CBS 223.65]